MSKTIVDPIDPGPGIETAARRIAGCGGARPRGAIAKDRVAISLEGDTFFAPDGGTAGDNRPPPTPSAFRCAGRGERPTAVEAVARCMRVAGPGGDQRLLVGWVRVSFDGGDKAVPSMAA
jgi:hypothetical protein